MAPKRTRGKNKSSTAIPSIAEDESFTMNIDSEDEAYVPGMAGLRDLVANFSSPSPNSTIPAPSSTSSFRRAASEPVGASQGNPFYNQFTAAYRRIDKSFCAQATPDKHFSTWSCLVGLTLEALFEPLESLSLSPTHPKQTSCDLSTLRHTLLNQINLIDVRLDELKSTADRPCPIVCSAGIDAPNPPALPKSYADVATQAIPVRPTPAASKRPATTPAPAPNQRRTSLPPSSSAPAARSLPVPPASAQLPPKPTPAQSKAKVQAPAVPEPVRLVVRFGGRPPQELRSRPQSDLFRRISNMLDVHPTVKGVVILGAHWNKSDNIIISFPHGTPEADVLELRRGIRAALGLADSVELSIVKPWSKLMVSSVPARYAPGTPVYSEADVATSLALNPAIKNIAISRPPRWIRNPNNITGAHSSIVFSIEDPDGTITRQLLKTSLFVFGAPVTIKRWQINYRPKYLRRSVPGAIPRAPARDNDVHMDA